MVSIFGCCLLFFATISAIPAAMDRQIAGYPKDRTGDITGDFDGEMLKREIHSSNGYSGGERKKRAMLRVIGALLKTANLRFSSKNYRLYNKEGGHNQALMDFRSLRPSKVLDLGTSRWGTVGDQTVIVRTKNGKTTMNIWTREKDPDSKFKLIVDKIEYTD